MDSVAQSEEQHSHFSSSTFDQSSPTPSAPCHLIHFHIATMHLCKRRHHEPESILLFILPKSRSIDRLWFTASLCFLETRGQPVKYLFTNCVDTSPFSSYYTDPSQIIIPQNDGYHRRHSSFPKLLSTSASVFWKCKQNLTRAHCPAAGEACVRGFVYL